MMFERMVAIKRILFIIIALVLFIFVGCQSMHTDVATQPTNLAEPTDESTEPTDESTEPTNESTEPSGETTEPTETVCPRTIEYFKSHLTPYMTWREAKDILGRPDKDHSNGSHMKTVRWYLEDNYYVLVVFYPVENESIGEYLATEPTDETKPDGSPVDDLFYYIEWFNHMQAYHAELHNDSSDEVIEVLFDCGGNPFWKEE